GSPLDGRCGSGGAFTTQLRRPTAIVPVRDDWGSIAHSDRKPLPNSRGADGRRDGAVQGGCGPGWSALDPRAVASWRSIHVALFSLLTCTLRCTSVEPFTAPPHAPSSSHVSLDLHTSFPAHRENRSGHGRRPSAAPAQDQLGA